MDDVSFDVARLQPGRQPEAIASRLVSDDDVLDLTPGLASFVAPTMQELPQRLFVGVKLLEGLAFNPGTTAETSHFDWLISITAMIVLSCSRTVRDLLASKRCDMGRSIGLL
jgi:hypothetical protein